MSVARSWVAAIGLAAVIVGLIGWFFVSLFRAIEPEVYDHRFSSGDCVVIRLTDERAMVVWAYSFNDRVKVRVHEGEVTDSAIFGPNVTTNKKYAVVTFRDFELEPCSG